jgi:5-methylcytosine-specific restriction enzyme B
MAYNLAVDADVRAACEAVGAPETLGTEWADWIGKLANTLTWFRAADREQRTNRAFQQRLWEENGVANVGQGDLPVGKALDDHGFREWLAARSLELLPTGPAERGRFLHSLYVDIRERLQPFLAKRTPHLKIFRVVAVMYPEAMTTVAGSGHLRKLAKAMNAPSPLETAEQHVWVRERLEEVLGPPSGGLEALALRMSLPWMLYEKFVATSSATPAEPLSPPSQQQPRLTPLPASRRRRGLTAVKGLFQSVLSSLEFLKDGRTKEELLDFLRLASPDSKTSSLSAAINVLQGELAVVRRDGDRYTLTSRGEDVLESQDSNHLADWLLTQTLGVDQAVVELRDRGVVPWGELVQAVWSSNRNWTTTYVPQSILSWLRSMGVIAGDQQARYRLTEQGQRWAEQVWWKPEALVVDPVVDPDPEPAIVPPPSVLRAVPPLAEIVMRVQASGHFPAGLVAQLHAGLWSHPRRHFAILTGLSGAGKTLLAREYARALTGEGGEGLFTLPVQPGWYDPGALLGYVNPLQRDSYVRTAFLEFLLKAVAHPERTYVAVLDEFNLSHPEQFMAPLLSAMETGDVIQLHSEDEVFDGVPKALPYPSNLALIGTVNMDETTHGLSDKVLDRAFVLEFWNVDLAEYPRWGKRAMPQEQEDAARALLTGLLEALAPARLHFGWRVVDDVLDFLRESAAAGPALPFDRALDAVVYAKVLPKLRGEDSPRFRTALKACRELATVHNLPESGGKLGQLQHDLETTGTARFWR